MSTEKSVCSIVIVDDHPLFRTGLATIIEAHPDMQVCGEAPNPAEGLALVVRLKPDIALIDLNLEQGSGFELIKSIKAQGLLTKVLVISGSDEQLYARRCLQAGASGFLSKIEASERLIDAIRKVLDGGLYLNSDVAGSLLSQAIAGRTSDDPVDKLTDREFEILRFYGRGLSTGTIARQLNLSAKTVGSHRASLMKKLGLQTRAELLQYAMRYSETGPKNDG